MTSRQASAPTSVAIIRLRGFVAGTGAGRSLGPGNWPDGWIHGNERDWNSIGFAAINAFHCLSAAAAFILSPADRTQQRLDRM